MAGPAPATRTMNTSWPPSADTRSPRACQSRTRGVNVMADASLYASTGPERRDGRIEEGVLRSGAKRTSMLLRHRPPGIESKPPRPAAGFEYIDHGWIAVLRWLQANRIDYVLVGGVAKAIRGARRERGPVAIVPAPYGRNLDRLARALLAAHARLRLDSGVTDPEGTDTRPVKLTAEKLVRRQRWTLRCGSHDLDIEGRPPGVPRYQELLYEAVRFEPAPDVAVEVASPEDIEHYQHVSRTGVAPEFRLARNASIERG